MRETLRNLIVSLSLSSDNFTCNIKATLSLAFGQQNDR